jgi:hypothetical protein
MSTTAEATNGTEAASKAKRRSPLMNDETRAIRNILSELERLPKRVRARVTAYVAAAAEDLPEPKLSSSPVDTRQMTIPGVADEDEFA